MGLFGKKIKTEEIRAAPEQETRQEQTLEVDGVLETLFKGLASDRNVTRDEAMGIPALAGCMEFICGIAASVPVKLYEAGPEEEKEVTGDHRLRILNEDTGDLLTGPEWKKAFFMDYMLRGRGWAYLNMKLNRLESLHYVDDQSVSVTTNEDPIFKKAIVWVQGKSYLPHQFVHMARNTRNGVRGDGLLNQAHGQLALALNYIDFENAIVRAGGNKRGFLQSEIRLSDTQLSDLKESFQKMYGSSYDGVTVLNKGLTFTPAQSTSVEMQLAENKARMTQERLEKLWPLVGGFRYVPVNGLSFLGDPRLEAGDIVTVTDLTGTLFRVPIMAITHEFDGGLKTEISAQGQSRSDGYEGPVQRETKRTIAKIIKTQQGIEMSVENTQSEISYLQMQAESIEGRVQDAEGNVSDLQIRADELEAKAENAAGDIADLQVQADEISGRVENTEGDLTQIKQTAGQVSVEAEDEGGKLETQINPKMWTAKRTDANGNVVSAFYFDFDVGQFVFDGTGKFMSADGKSYITLEGNEFVLYAREGEAGDFIGIARIGFTEDSEGYDYPYFLMGSADEDGSNFDKIGLIKMFKNGMRNSFRRTNCHASGTTAICYSTEIL